MTAMPPVPTTPPPPHKPVVPAPPRGGAPSLATFLDRIAPLVDVALPTGDPRQETTAPGNPLPEEDADMAIDPALLFVPSRILPAVSRPVSPFGGLGVEPGAAIDTVPGPLVSPPDAAPGDLIVAKAEIRGEATARVDIVEGKAATRPDAATRTAKDVMARQEAPTAPIIAARATPLIETAGRVFAQAIHSATASEDPRAQRVAEPAAITVAATTDSAAHAVTATGDAQHSALDLTQRDWPRTMIDRIETLRDAAADAANAADTRIRLIPDALGTIDVSLRTEGEMLHVHFAAEQAQTRALLADAQSRLTELAEAGGLKLSQSGVDGDTGPQQHQPSARTALSPTPNRAIERTVTSDYRIA